MEPNDKEFVNVECESLADEQELFSGYYGNHEKFETMDFLED